jgi:hypothetical protein
MKILVPKFNEFKIEECNAAELYTIYKALKNRKNVLSNGDPHYYNCINMIDVIYHALSIGSSFKDLD